MAATETINEKTLINHAHSAFDIKCPLKRLTASGYGSPHQNQSSAKRLIASPS